MKTSISMGGSLLALALIFSVASFAITAKADTTWNTTGNYIIAMNYLGTDYSHDLSLTGNSAGDLTGYGGSPAGANIYTYVITSGSVSDSTIDFLADYTATPDAVTPQTTLHIMGTIALDGTMSGNWTDNYQGGARSGTWSTTAGNASLFGNLAAEDFGVVSYDTGLGMIEGYTAGFGLTDMTFAGAQSVSVALYSGNTLLQTNTAILPKFNADITGTQFSSPFDVSGSFDYETDGYWTNTREIQYGQSVPATRVVATITLSNGKIVTAENTNLTGDPTTIYPAATHIITSSTGLNGSVSPLGSIAVVDGNNQVFTISANVGYSIDDVLVDGTSVGPASTYTFIGVDGNHTISATFTADEIAVSPKNKNECKNGGWMNFTNPNFKNQGQCVNFTNHQ